jgi:heat shock protein HspQ
MSKTSVARFHIGQVVRHKMLSLRGVIFDVDAEFANSMEWYEALPADTRPPKDQPFYRLFAENVDTEYMAYLSEQDLLPDTSGKPVRHSDLEAFFDRDEGGTSYRRRDIPLN